MSKSSESPQGKPSRGCLTALVREIIMPLGMALFVILFVIQAFKIPSASMENSLLVGDFLLGLKIPYGAPIPFVNANTPAFTDPKPGDILIFRYPGDPDYPDNNPQRYRYVVNLFLFGVLFWDKQPETGQSHLVLYQRKDFIKRCVAESGQTVKVEGTSLYIDGQLRPLPRHGKYMPNRGVDPMRDSVEFRLPKPGETLRLDTLSLRMATWIRSLALQENPNQKVEMNLDFVRDSVVDNQYVLPWINGDMHLHHHLNAMILMRLPAVRAMAGDLEYLHAENIPFSKVQEVARTGFVSTTSLAYPDGQKGMFRNESSDYFLPNYLEFLAQNIEGQAISAGSHYRLRPSLIIDGVRTETYTVKNKCYFMMGDNRDNSSDGRYWGLLSRNFVKARATLIYFSFENADGEFALTNPLTWFRIPFRIRYSRVGKLIE